MPTLLDPDFTPATQWNGAFEKEVSRDPAAQTIVIGVGTKSGNRVRRSIQLLGEATDGAERNLKYVERLVKSLLWIQGGSQIWIGGCDSIARQLRAIYSNAGERAFDVGMLGDKIYREDFEVYSCSPEEVPEPPADAASQIGRHLDGCRIGFDLGGSDRKAAAVIDGEVVFSEEIAWDPYFQSDPEYHLAGIIDSLEKAAKHLPRIDAVGGSAAGVYVDNEVRAASLFRGVSDQDFDRRVRRLFFEVMDRMGWKEIPWRLVNDGEVTALAGSMSIGKNSLLGLSMGTSFAAGYVDPEGRLSNGLNELAFVPVDYREKGPVDEWSGDQGCGVQYFSQQGVARLAKLAGIDFDDEVPFPERLIGVQDLMKQGDQRAKQIYQTIGENFGHAIIQYSDLYDLEHLLILGRVTSGDGGQMILDEARALLDDLVPELSERIAFHIPDEKQKRHGQAVAAASLAASK